jgi:hypothetical protein
MTFSPSSCIGISSRVAIVVAVASGVGWAGEPQGGAHEALSTTIETTAGVRETGGLAAIGTEQIRLTTPAGERTFAVNDVRTISRDGDETRPAARIRLIGTDGMRLAGTDVAWNGEVLTLTTPAGPVTMPAARVQTIICDRTPPPAATPGDPEWLTALPEELDSDVVVVAKGEGVQFVACAITSIAADTVTVSLDGETIPVKRDRVVGMRWLREPTSPGGVSVRVAGGIVPATRVTWSPEALLVDDVRLPPSALEAIDYAAGRTVRLATLPTEQLDVEPFFGGLASIEGVAGFFQPRAVHTAGDSPARNFVVRPRTTAVWRIPPGSRTFATSFSTAGSASSGGSVVVIAIDGTEVFRGTVDPTPPGGQERTPIGPIALQAARRLSLTVDYGTAGPAGGVVMFHDPVFEK